MIKRNNYLFFLFKFLQIFEDFRIQESVSIDAPEVIQVVPGVEGDEVVGDKVGQDRRQANHIL